MPTLLLFVACSGSKTVSALPEPEPAPPTPSAAGASGLTFSGIPLTSDLDQAVVPTVTDEITLAGQSHPIGFRVLGRSGSDGFGMPRREDGTFLPDACHSQDFNSLLEAHGELFLLSHFECTPGDTYISVLDSDGDGVLTRRSTHAADWSDWGGLWFPCAGQVTSWGSHLGAEEYEPNARNRQADGSMVPDPFGAWKQMMRYPTDPSAATPYHYGYITEITLTDAEGTAQATKHPALGRFSHELGFVVGDNRTVYLSDDGRAVGWFMFVSDGAGDLTAGTLYAATLTQRSDTAFGVGWISLGHATDQGIRNLIDADITFSDMFDVAEVTDGACPEGFRWTHHSHGKECLRLAEASDRVPDPAMAASRLETRRYAAMLGATTELEKAEGITWDPETGQVYLAISRVGGRMATEADAPTDHIQLPSNDCGAVWGGNTRAEQQDTDGAPIDSPHVMVDFRPVLEGRPQEPDASGNRCDVDGIANPDNITLLPGHGIMVVAEDTSLHRINIGWAHDLSTGSLTRILAAPRGAEVTGVHWIPDLRGHGYLTVSFQHPWAELPQGEVVPTFVTEDDRRSFTGYLGPFPSLSTP